MKWMSLKILFLSATDTSQIDKIKVSCFTFLRDIFYQGHKVFVPNDLHFFNILHCNTDNVI